MNYLANSNLATRNITAINQHTFLKQLGLILAGVVFLTLVSQLSIPLRPVPLTFQSTTVVLMGIIFGGRYSTWVLGIYLLAGAVGIPVFANFSGGPAIFYGPTVGYLIGFFPAVWISGYLAQKGFTAHILTRFLTALLATAVIFFFGLMVLAQSIGWHSAIAFGLMPFIVSEPSKLLALTLLPTKWWNKNK